MAQAAHKTKPAPDDAPEPELKLAEAEAMLEVPPAAVVIERLLEIRRVAEAAGQPLSLEAMASGIGCHHGTLGRVLNPRARWHRDASDEFVAKAWSWIRLLEMRSEDDEVGRIVETSVTARVAKLCEYCQAERIMGMLVSETSAGKTTALLAYKARNPAAIYVHATRGTRSVNGLVDAIWRGAGCRDRGRRMTFADRWRDVCRVLASKTVTSRVILVDDAHSLPYPAVEALREIHDETNVGVVLAGTTRLQEHLTLAGDAHQMYEQTRARVQMVRTLGRPAPADVAAVAAAWTPQGLRLAKDAIAYLCEVAQHLGALRVVKAHVRVALRMTGRYAVDGRRGITRADLERAHTQLTDQRSALA